MNTYLASVGTCEAFRKVNGKLVHFFSAKTLTDSSINISVSSEEVRGGMGAQLIGQFFHTSTFGLSMTDVLFKLEYIQAQVGGEIIEGGYGLTDESLTVVEAPAGSGTKNPVLQLSGIPIQLLDGMDRIVWYNRPGSTEYQTATFPANQVKNFLIEIPGAAEGDAYCVHYYASKEDARKLIVRSDFIPSELVVFLTTRLFAGEASAAETGKPVGSVTVKIPRFQLNGTVDLSMAMSSQANVSLQGNALVYNADCEGGAYAEIVEYIAVSPYDGYTSLVADLDTVAVDETVAVYAIGERKLPMLIPNDELTFSDNTSISKPGVVLVADKTVGVTFTYKDLAGKNVELTGSILTEAKAETPPEEND